MLGFIFHHTYRKQFARTERTMLMISIGFKRVVPIEIHDSEIEERAKEMRDHPAFARSKRFLPKSPP